MREKSWVEKLKDKFYEVQFKLYKKFKIIEFKSDFLPPTEEVIDVDSPDNPIIIKTDRTEWKVETFLIIQTLRKRREYIYKKSGKVYKLLLDSIQKEYNFRAKASLSAYLVILPLEEGDMSNRTLWIRRGKLDRVVFIPERILSIFYENPVLSPYEEVHTFIFDFSVVPHLGSNCVIHSYEIEHFGIQDCVNRVRKQITRCLTKEAMKNAEEIQCRAVRWY